MLKYVLFSLFVGGTALGAAASTSGIQSPTVKIYSGSVIGSAPAVSGADFLEFFPYVNMTYSTTGTWVNVKGYKSCTCVVTIDPSTSGATLYITMTSTNTGSTLPVATFNGIQAGSSILTSGIYPFDGIASWFKLRVDANASSTVSASCIARRR